jgi:hypothetical protein
MSRTEKTAFSSTGKWRKLGRAVYAVVPFVVVGMLIVFSGHLIVFTMEDTFVPYEGEDVVAMLPSQTYGYNVTISYVEFPPNQAPGTLRENGSIVAQFYPIRDTVTSWTRMWLPISIRVNETAYLNRSLAGPQEVLEDWSIIHIAHGTTLGIVDPEVSQGGTYRLLLQTMGSVDVQLRISWRAVVHYYKKPYFYYGVLGLVVALLYPSMFLIRQAEARQQNRRALIIIEIMNWPISPQVMLEFCLCQLSL